MSDRILAMLRKYPFTPILGWSVSRYEKFDRCKRWYYYDYYARKHDKDVSPQDLAFLRSLTSASLEIGNAVHDTIATLLRRLKRKTSPIDTEKVLNYSSSQVDRAIEGKNFLEVYYGQRETIDAADLKDRVGSCLKNFFGSRWYEWLTGEAIPGRSSWIIEPGDYGELRINGLKAYCKADFLFPITEGNLCILDWKTGKADRERHRRQMMGYVLYARDIFKVAADEVKAVIVYLDEPNEELESSFSGSELDEFAGQIAKETEEMYRYCENIEENIPRPKSFFPKQAGRLCAYCNYRELCESEPEAKRAVTCP
ncbi:PD-(D/E)XK nuclease family protein [Dehalococcoidia bacterium]|nr:PD-(D/E)XK nuclease family protein [Dehalococcoidia bacterium]MCL0084064.1 PD-(D/E)XK nuclease family protein [Dehalococcoidia bacterium]